MKVLDLFSKYSISEDGTIRNKKNNRTLKPHVSNAGYLRVELRFLGKPKKFFVHRLVALKFLEPVDGKLFVNHVDGNKLNNCAVNLQWVTRSENQLHAYRTGLQAGYRVSGNKISDGHRKALVGSRWRKEVHIYNLAGAVFLNTDSAAKFFKVSRQTILNRCKSDKWPEWSKEKIKQIGNSVIPQIPELIGRALMEHERGLK